MIACTASGNVSGTLYVGGVVGYNNGTVTACYHASGNVSGTSNVGGVVGRNTSGTVTACYHASGNVSPAPPMSAAWWDTTYPVP